MGQSISENLLGMPPRVQLEKDTWQIQQGIMLEGLCIPSGLGTPLDPPGGPGTGCKEEGGPDSPLGFTQWESGKRRLDEEFSVPASEIYNQ